MDDLLKYLLPVLALGYLIYNLIKLVLYRKLKRERRDYEAIVEENMAKMEQDIKDRSRDLQDSMQMINQEYSQLMKSMSLQQREHADYLNKKMEEFKKNSSDSDRSDDQTDDQTDVASTDVTDSTNDT